MSDPTDMDRGYRRGAIMGLTMAEAFILIAFALLLLFAFWQWEEERENTPEVQAFKGLPYDRRQTVLAASQDGSIEAFMALQEAGVDLKALASLQQAGQTLEDIASKISQAEAQQETMVGALKGALGDIVSGVGGQIDGNGSIILPDTILFEQGSASITPVLDKFLANACEPWIATLKGSGVDIAEIKIEGHASSEWRAQSSPKQAYLGNLDLSQRRSQAVLRVCLDFIRDSSVLEWARTHMIAVGYSSVRPVMKNGQEDKAASRRVIFSATPNRKKLIDQIGTEANSGRDDNGFQPYKNLKNSTKNHVLETSTTSVMGSEFSTSRIEGRVTYIRDTDTIFVAGIPIRINGLDAVERDTAGFEQAKLFAQRLVHGKIIKCELNGKRTHDRLVGTCYVDGEDYAAVVIANGHGLDCRRYSKGRYAHHETPKAKRNQARAPYCR